jgi:transposase-like protein
LKFRGASSTTAASRPPIISGNMQFCNRLYDVEIRRVICSTNAIESINARYRRAIRARGHFPTEQAALKCLHLVTRSLDPRWRTDRPTRGRFAI